jgi:hypothetical protein
MFSELNLQDIMVVGSYVIPIYEQGELLLQGFLGSSEIRFQYFFFSYIERLPPHPKGGCPGLPFIDPHILQTLFPIISKTVSECSTPKTLSGFLWSISAEMIFLINCLLPKSACRFVFLRAEYCRWTGGHSF